MKRLIPLLCLLLTLGSLRAEDDSVLKNIRKIRRAFLDVLELIPTPEEIDWYVVYNQDGYALAVDYLVKHTPEDKKAWTREELLDPAYLSKEEEMLDKSVLERNVVYLSGQSKTDVTPESIETAKVAFIKQALLASDDNAANAIDYMVNELVCRPATLTEANELLQIFAKVSLKADEMDAWKTVLAHIFELHDCKYK